jgi:DNA helicase-2/ATP-dependent DNA helicase PcrA
LASALATLPERDAVLATFDATAGPIDGRVTALARWVKETPLSVTARTVIEGAGHRLRTRTRNVLGEWAALLTDRQALGAGFATHAPGEFTEGQLDQLHRWGVDRERLRHAGKDDNDDEVYALDTEDDALLLRLHQLQKGPLVGPKGPIAYEHLMVDEVQDFAPIELSILLDSTTSARSITLAGDTAQAIAPEHGFSTWSDMLDDLGIPHDRVEPLRVSYRSTREIVDCALHVLGPLGGDARPVAPRSGAPVETFGFGSAGEACEFLARALKDLVREEPHASVAVIARHPEQARLYHEAMSAAEVPALRLVAAQDFSFRPGIDVTDVRQTKGLEFDIVILVEVNEDSYPDSDHARRLLHVAMTRGAHQLWVTYTGTPSPLLP